MCAVVLIFFTVNFKILYMNVTSLKQNPNCRENIQTSGIPIILTGEIKNNEPEKFIPHNYKAIWAIQRVDQHKSKNSTPKSIASFASAQNAHQRVNGGVMAHILDHPQIRIVVHFRIMSRVLDAICFTVFYGNSFIIIANIYLRPPSPTRITELSRLIALWRFIKKFREVPGFENALFISIYGDLNLPKFEHKLETTGVMKIIKYTPDFFECPLQYLMNLANLHQINHVTNPSSGNLIVFVFNSRKKFGSIEMYSGRFIFKNSMHHVPIICSYPAIPLSFSFPSLL